MAIDLPRCAVPPLVSTIPFNQPLSGLPLLCEVIAPHAVRALRELRAQPMNGKVSGRRIRSNDPTGNITLFDDGR